jgi:phosphohistidine phosphatase
LKHITLIRHAKSSWDHPGLSDFERPLNARGERDLPGLVERATTQLPSPDRLIYSGAVRTRLTSQPLAEAWGLDEHRWLERREAYEASLDRLVALLREQPDDCHHLVLVGHNPGMAEVLTHLTAAPARDCPTAAFAHIELGIDQWSGLTQGCGHLLIFDYPKLH